MSNNDDGGIWGFLRKFFKSQESKVHTKEHEALDDEDKIIEDILIISRHIFKNEQWNNVEKIEARNSYEYKAYFTDGSVQEYQLDWYLRGNDDLKERLNEIECLWYQSDESYIFEELTNKSIEFFKK